MSNYTLTRRQSREAGMIFFYEYLINEEYYNNKSEFFNVARFIKEGLDDLNIVLQEKFKTKKEISLIEDELFISIVKEVNEIDDVKKYLNSLLDDNWRFGRISKVDQAILLISYIQIKHSNIDKKIVINEAIELAKEFSEKDSYKYINGVLDKVE